MHNVNPTHVKRNVNKTSCEIHHDIDEWDQQTRMICGQRNQIQISKSEPKIFGLNRKNYKLRDASLDT